MQIPTTTLEDIILRDLAITMYKSSPLNIEELSDLIYENNFVVLSRSEFSLADIELIRSTARLLIFDKYNKNVSVIAEYVSSLQLWGFRVCR